MLFFFFSPRQFFFIPLSKLIVLLAPFLLSLLLFFSLPRNSHSSGRDTQALRAPAALGPGPSPSLGQEGAPAVACGVFAGEGRCRRPGLGVGVVSFYSPFFVVLSFVFSTRHGLREGEIEEEMTARKFFVFNDVTPPTRKRER